MYLYVTVEEVPSSVTLRASQHATIDAPSDSDTRPNEDPSLTNESELGDEERGRARDKNRRNHGLLLQSMTVQVVPESIRHQSLLHRVALGKDEVGFCT